eukprot:4263104-Amphidinium_carterae.1
MVPESWQKPQTLRKALFQKPFSLSNFIEVPSTATPKPDYSGLYGSGTFTRSALFASATKSALSLGLRAALSW